MKYQTISLFAEKGTIYLSNYSNGDLFMCEYNIFMCEDILFLCKSSHDISLVFIY